MCIYKPKTLSNIRTEVSDLTINESHVQAAVTKPDKRTKNGERKKEKRKTL
jgi:hypothetical protein